VLFGGGSDQSKGLEEGGIFKKDEVDKDMGVL
jgi:hypothetical protein